MRTRTRFLCEALIGCLLAAPAASMSADAAKLVEHQTSSLAIGPGDEVSLQYTIFDDKGKELETSLGKAPLTYVSGRNGDQTKIVRVVEVKDKTIVIDFNHPYAGKTLAYHVKVLDVKKAAE